MILDPDLVNKCDIKIVIFSILYSNNISFYESKDLSQREIFLPDLMILRVLLGKVKLFNARFINSSLGNRRIVIFNVHKYARSNKFF